MIGRKKNKDGLYIGRKHRLPSLDSRVFTVQFADGEEKDIGFNVLAEHLFSQVDTEGNQYRIFREIINHRRRDSAVAKEDGFRKSKRNKIRKKTSTGWDFEVEWKDGTTSWLPLKTIKETNAVDIAEYAKQNGLQDEPGFVVDLPR